MPEARLEIVKYVTLKLSEEEARALKGWLDGSSSSVIQTILLELGAVLH